MICVINDNYLRIGPGVSLMPRIILALSCLFAAPVLPAQSATAAARAKLARLAPLIGTWTMSGLPEGVHLTETCEWFVGERHVVCQMRSQSPQWQRGALTIFSYDAVDSTYTMTAFGSGGQHSAARGRPRGDTLVFEGELRTAAGSKRTRVTIVPRSDGFDLLEAEADGQGGWGRAGRVRYIRSPGAHSPR